MKYSTSSKKSCRANELPPNPTNYIKPFLKITFPINNTGTKLKLARYINTNKKQ